MQMILNKGKFSVGKHDYSIPEPILIEFMEKEKLKWNGLKLELVEPYPDYAKKYGLDEQQPDN